MSVSVTIQAYPILFFIIGIVLCIFGFLFIFKNSKVAKQYQNVIGKFLPFKFFRSNTFGKYMRIRYYVFGIILLLLGLFFIYVALN
jgi:hypothetical protein